MKGRNFEGIRRRNERNSNTYTWDTSFGCIRKRWWREKEKEQSSAREEMKNKSSQRRERESEFDQSLTHQGNIFPSLSFYSPQVKKFFSPRREFFLFSSLLFLEFKTLQDMEPLETRCHHPHHPDFDHHPWIQIMLAGEKAKNGSRMDFSSELIFPLLSWSSWRAPTFSSSIVLFDPPWNPDDLCMQKGRRKRSIDLLHYPRARFTQEETEGKNSRQKFV